MTSPRLTEASASTRSEAEARADIKRDTDARDRWIAENTAREINTGNVHQLLSIYSNFSGGVK